MSERQTIELSAAAASPAANPRAHPTICDARLRAPRCAAAWNQLGAVAHQTRRYSESEANFSTALDADPEDFEPLVNLGGVLLNLRRPREAMAYNQGAVVRTPNGAHANSELGLPITS